MLFPARMKVRFVALAAALAAAGPRAPAHADPCPSLSTLRRAARDHAGLAELPAWRGRARRAALLPLVTVRAARGLDWDDGGVSTGLPTEVGNSVVVEARFTWRLDRLVFEPAEPRLQGVEREVHRARAAVDAEVTRLYFRWRRARLAQDGGGASEQLDVEEAWAELDGLTGGKLTRERCRP